MKINQVALALGLSGPAAIDAQTPVSMKNVEMQATLHADTRQIDAVIRVAIATPIGKIPVSGHGKLEYSCAGTFTGTMAYNPIVRFFAKIKGVALVTALDGHVVTVEPVDCTSSLVRKLVGRADVDSTLMKGWIKMGADSVGFRGPAWTFGDSTYHSVLATHLENKPLELHINMYKHPRMMKAARK
jgi:hypothetical protein